MYTAVQRERRRTYAHTYAHTYMHTHDLTLRTLAGLGLVGDAVGEGGDVGGAGGVGAVAVFGCACGVVCVGVSV